MSNFHLQHAALSRASGARSLCRVFPSALDEAEERRWSGAGAVVLRRWSAAESPARTAVAWVCVTRGEQRGGSTWRSQSRQAVEPPGGTIRMGREPAPLPPGHLHRAVIGWVSAALLRRYVVVSFAPRCQVFFYFFTSLAVQSLIQRLDLGSVTARIISTLSW